MKNIIPNSLSQVYERILHNGRIAIFTQVNNFKAGELDLHDSTFYCVHRSSKNIMRMFKGLGMNEEILTQYKFKFIVIPFNSSQLKTTRLKWLRDGIKSPFCNDLVDSQLILPLNKINMMDIPDNTEENQLTLFKVCL